MAEVEALLREFDARKEQVLSLEMRQFWLILALECFFAIAFVYSSERVRQHRAFALGSGTVYFVLFFELLAINAKMGLVSNYLRQLESCLTGLGFTGLVWESKAVDQIIFRSGNSFTISAIVIMVLIFAQTWFVMDCNVCHLISNKIGKNTLAIVLLSTVVLLVAKSLSVDFGTPLPNVFERSAGDDTSSAKP